MAAAGFDFFNYVARTLLVTTMEAVSRLERLGLARTLRVVAVVARTLRPLR